MKALIALTVLSVLTMISEMVNFKRILLPLVLVGLAVVFAVNGMDWDIPRRYYNDMIFFDNYAVAFTGLLVATAFLWFLHSEFYFRGRNDTRSDKYALVLFSLVGAVLLCSYSNLVMLFLGIEILSIPMYVLAGSRKTELSSNEAAMKYFLMGAFATGILLFGIALVYGATGSFHLEAISRYISNTAFVDPIFYVGAGMMVIGLAFKISAVPFHFWTPDVYEGSPTIITTYMATVVKTAAFAAFFRLFAYSFTDLNLKINTLISVIAALTILVGNITAVYQNNVKRMLAYSSIAHAGYMLLAIVAINQLSASSVILYATAYSISTIASFSVLFLVLQYREGETFESFRGMAKTNPFLAFVTIVSMLSLAGIPPTAGFFAKYYIFTAALQENHIILVLIAVLGSLIGVYFYFRVIIALFQPAETEIRIEISNGFKTVLFISALLAIFIGIFPNLLIGLI